MLPIPRTGAPLDQLANRIRLAAEPSSSLLHGVVAACDRFKVLRQAGMAWQFDTWCTSGAWIDVSLALLASELPNWSVRRLVKDSGVWFCSLSRSPNMPFEFDDMVEAGHEDMALAILLAFLEAKRTGLTIATAKSTPAGDAATEGHRICCDNFA